MRTLVVSSIVSLDGYSDGPGGNVMALPMDPFFDAHNLERLQAAETLLMGATTFRGFQQYWPGVADAPAGPSDQGQTSPVNREISRRDNEIDKVVVSDSLAPEELTAWRDTTRVVRRADAHAAVAELREQDGGDILVFGSRTLWNDLLAAGLVDELRLMVAPVVLAGGTPAFAAPYDLELAEVRREEDSANVLLTYRPR